MLKNRVGVNPSQLPLWETTFRKYYAGTMSGQDWDDWHASRLQSVVEYVQRQSPFYKKHFAGVDPAAITLENFASLPTTSKSDLRHNLHDVLSMPMSQAAVYYETTGTTGAPTPCPRAPIDVELSNFHVTQSWRQTLRENFPNHDPVIGFMGPAELYAFADTFGDVAADLGYAHVKIWPESPRVGFRKALRLIQELQVEVIVCAPALCLNLARAALHNGINPKDLPIKLFLVLGEVCSQEFKANVASVWDGAQVIPTLYGSQEAMAIATGCSQGHLHLAEPNYVLELLDPQTGRSLGSRGRGELCLTMLVEGIKPLVRYRTGDYVAVGENVCDCGHPGVVIDVLGRVDDAIGLGRAALQPAELESLILAEVTGCLGYQVVLTEGDGEDLITVRLCVQDEHVGPVRDLAPRIASRITQACGAPAEVDIVQDLDPITNTGAYVSWKAARISDERHAPGAVEKAARQFAAAHAVTS